jgi:hypothetical protein
MSYRAETFTRTGNGKMANDIKNLAKRCNLIVDSITADGWVLKTITIMVYGHADDIAHFEKMLPDGVQS